jgi:hypothetical protein
MFISPVDRHCAFKRTNQSDDDRRTKDVAVRLVLRLVDLLVRRRTRTRAHRRATDADGCSSALSVSIVVQPQQSLARHTTTVDRQKRRLDKSLVKLRLAIDNSTNLVFVFLTSET